MTAELEDTTRPDRANVLVLYLTLVTTRWKILAYVLGVSAVMIVEFSSRRLSMPIEKELAMTGLRRAQDDGMEWGMIHWFFADGIAKTDVAHQQCIPFDHPEHATCHTQVPIVVAGPKIVREPTTQFAGVEPPAPIAGGLHQGTEKALE